MNEAQRLLDPLSNVDVIDGIDVLTSVLEPITSSTTSCKFHIESRAFLQKDARLLFNVSASGSANACAFNNLSGGLGAIQRIVLRYGTKVIHDIDYSGYVVARRQAEKSLTRRSDRDKYRYFCNPKWFYDTDGQLDFESTEYANSGQGNTPNGWRFAISNDATKPSQVSVTLSELLPIFRNPLCALPLYALRYDYQMNIEIFWADADEYVVTASDQAGANKDAIAMPTITIANPQLVLNYVYYPQEIEDLYTKQINSNQGYLVYYTDTIHNQSHIPAQASEGITTHRIQMSGHELHKLNVSVRQNHRSLWYARACSKDMPSKKFNVRINDAPIFSEDVENQGWQYHLWSSSAPNDRLYVMNGQYSSSLNATQSAPVETAKGLGNTYDIQGNENWIVVDFRKNRSNPVSLGNGFLVGNNPIEFLLSYAPNTTADPKADESYNLHIHSEISRILQIQNGEVEVSF